MLVEVSLLGKTLLAILETTNKRSFACMNAQVVKEIMELLEELLAPFEIATQDFDLAMGRRIFELVNDKFFGIGHEFFHLEGPWVKLFASYHLNLGVSRNLLPEFMIQDFFALH